MVTGLDAVSTQTVASSPATAIPPTRPTTIQPGTERGRFNDRRQKDQSQGGESFRSSLEQVENKASQFIAEVQARRAERKVDDEKIVRAEKRPTTAPAELPVLDRADLYAEAQALQLRAAVTSKQADTTKSVDEGAYVPSSPEFMIAASRYAERFFSVAGSYAKPGDSLELSA